MEALRPENGIPKRVLEADPNSTLRRIKALGRQLLVEEDESAVEMTGKDRREGGVGIGGRFSGVARAQAHRAKQKSSLHLGDCVEITAIEEVPDEQVVRHSAIKSTDDRANPFFT